MENGRLGGLDHPKFDVCGVIQRENSLVIHAMHLAAQTFSTPLVSLFPPWPRSRHLQGYARSRVAAMTSEREQPGRQTDWAGRIAKIAAQEDRIAFSELFEYFAPRIKAFMLRSGASRRPC